MGEDKNEKRFYDVDRFVQEKGSKDRKPSSLIARALRKFTDRFRSMEGFWMFVLAFPLIFGGPGLIIYLGVIYGPVAFYSALIGGLAFTTLIIEKRYGAHIIVGDIPLVRRTLVLVPAFLLILAVFALVFFLAGRI